MNLVLFRTQELHSDGTLVLSDQRCAHLQRVLQVREGDTVRVGQINGRLGTGTIKVLSANNIVLTVVLTHAPCEKLPVSVILALPRPKMLRRIIRTIAEMGIRDLHLINSYRVEKSYWQSPVLAADVIEDYLLQGLSQARDTVLPQVSLHPRFKPFVEDTLPSIANNRRVLLAHPGEALLSPADESIDSVLIVGPEGGFIPYEVDKLQAAGALQVNLGERILRVDTALPALLGRLLVSSSTVDPDTSPPT